MLSREENDLLTQTGPGTPGGELLRRYWQPVALAEELPEGGAPIPIRLLSEDLTLFRDEHGRIGIVPSVQNCSLQDRLLLGIHSKEVEERLDIRPLSSKGGGYQQWEQEQENGSGCHGWTPHADFGPLVPAREHSPGTV